MKKILLSFFTGLSLFSSFAQTQMPNSDFENWSLVNSENNLLAPDNWADGLACVTFNGNEECSSVIKRITDATSGNYALAYFNTQIGDNVDFQTYSNLTGFDAPAFTGKPKSFSLDYKYSTDDNQGIAVQVLLFKGSLTGSFTIIATKTYDFSPANSYTRVTQDLQYLSTSNPEFVLIKFDYSDDPATAKDTLKVDNFTFNYSSTAIENENSNPIFTAAVNNGKLITSAPIENMVIVDMRGVEVISSTNASNEFTVSNLQKGIYILRGETDNKIVSERILIY